MEKTRLSSKGQIILPKAVRDGHRWAAGTEFLVEDTPEGILLRPVRGFPATTVDEVFGSLRYSGKAKSLEEMDEAITAEVKRRHASGRY